MTHAGIRRLVLDERAPGWRIEAGVRETGAAGSEQVVK
jgi:hypothetical protein